MAENSVVDGRGLTRRAALLAPLALSGCGLINGDWFSTTKKPLPGQREPVLPPGHSLEVDPNAPRVVLPPPVRNQAWPQAGGNPTHDMGHLAAAPDLNRAWEADIGVGGGYRRALLAQPVVANGTVFTMDSAGNVSAFALSGGARRWRTPTRGKHVRSSNVGGGLATANGTLYAVNGLGDLVALDTANGAQKWRIDLGAPGRSSPTVVEGRLFLTTIQDELIAIAADDGHRIWSYQGSSASPAVLGRPAPAFANGLLVAGFSSGELACLRADSGSVIWTDSLGGVSVSAGVADFSAIRGRPAISQGRVIASGLGGLTLALDLPTGRRLWSRDFGSEDSPWIAGDWVFMVSLSQELAALTLADGAIAWISPLPRWNNPKRATGPITWYGPSLLSNRLVVVGTDRNALSVSPYTGAILGRQHLPSPAAPLEPVIADGTLLMMANNGTLLALR
jgi:outer membrane protein assembly factor BamB